MRTTTVTLPDDLYERLKTEAKKRGCSMAEILRRTLEQQLRSGTGPVVSLRDLPRHAGGGLKQPLEDADVLGEMLDDQLRH